MAYTWITVASAFGKDETHPNGKDYQPAQELLNRILDTGEGRLYVNSAGELVYESRYHREA